MLSYADVLLLQRPSCLASKAVPCLDCAGGTGAAGGRHPARARRPEGRHVSHRAGPAAARAHLAVNRREEDRVAAGRCVPVFFAVRACCGGESLLRSLQLCMSRIVAASTPRYCKFQSCRLGHGSHSTILSGNMEWKFCRLVECLSIPALVLKPFGMHAE